MRKFLSVLATAILVLQSMGTSLVYAQAANEWNEGWESITAVETVVEESAPEADSADEAPAQEETATEEVVAEPEVLEESAPAEEVADEPEVLDEGSAVETPVEEENVEEPAEVVEPVEEVPAVVEEPKVEVVEENTTAEKEVAEPEEKSALAAVVDSVFSNPLKGYVDWIYVTVEDPLGWLPAWVRMELAPVLEEHVFDLIDNSLDAKVTKVVAVDITFYDANNEKVEPTQPINVKMVAWDMPEAQSVVHVEADYNEEKIEVWEANVEEIVAEIEGDTAKFEAESFSIYAFVDYKYLTVNLYNGWGEPVIIKVKSASELVESEDHASIVYDPGVRTLNDWEVFRGWIAEKAEYTTEDAKNWKTIADIRSSLASEFTLSENKTVNFYAMIFNVRTVTYYDTNDVILKTDEILYNVDEDAPKYTVNEPYTPIDDTVNFEWWMDLDKKDPETGEPLLYANGTENISLENNLRLKASVQEWHWLVFDENGKGGTYNAPRFIKNDEVTVEPRPASEMVRNGYTFGWWYKDAACTDGNEFTFGQGLTDNTTIYAKWTANATAPYTILIWKQNVAWDWYDFERSISLDGNVWNVINTVSSYWNWNNAYARVKKSNNQNEDIKFEGFHLKEFDQNVTIKTEWNSILNVYYDRNEVTLTFIRRNNHQWETLATMKGLYWSTLESNGFIWPSNYNWYDDYKSWMGGYEWNGTRTTFMDSFITHNGESVTFYGFTPNGWSATVEFYKQNADKSDYVKDIDIKVSGWTFYISDKYSWFKASKYTKDSSQEVWLWERDGDWYYASVSNYNTLRIYYDRLEYWITFMDGKYVDGNNNPIDEEEQGKIKEILNIAYGTNLESYNKWGENYYTPEAPEWYVFEGWYADDNCTHPYTFTAMPEWVTVYAKWRQIQYRVFLHPNAGTEEKNPTLTWGSDSQQMNFRVPYKWQISLPEWKMDGYEFVGWYADAWFTKWFNESTKLTDDDAIAYDKSTDFTDPMDKWWNGATTNGDTDRFWITKKVDLYARWRSTLEWADGINVVYVDNDWETELSKDAKIYVDSAEAVARDASEAPANQQFKYWVLQTWDGNAFVDTSTKVYPWAAFAVLKVNASRVKNADYTDEKPSYTYTVQLRAEYGDIEKAEPTSIEYYNGDELVYTWTGNVNEEFTFAEALTEAWNEFLGWTDWTHVYTGWTTGYAADNEWIEPWKANILNAKWKCENGEHLDGDVCVAKATRSCTKNENLEEWWKYDEKSVEVEWNGTDWWTPAPCDKVCDGTQDYHDYNWACVKEVEKDCKPNDPVDGWIDIPWKVKVSWDDSTNNWAEVTENCKKACDTNKGYYPDGDNCVKEKVDECKDPENKDNNAIYTETWSYTRSGNAWEAPECTIVGCEDHYVLNEAKDECVLASHTLTIKYVYVDGSDAAATHTETLNYGSEYGVTSPEVLGYTPNKITVSWTMWDENIEEEVTYTANGDTKYTVEHYFKWIGENAEYVIDSSKTETLAWTTDAEVTATPLQWIEGFEYNATKSADTIRGKIEADGSLVLKVYYDRVKVNVIVNPKDPECDNNNEQCEKPTEGEKEYGDKVTLPYVIRSYTLTYKVWDWAPSVTGQTVQWEIDYYCKGNSSDCEDANRIVLDWADREVEVTESVTYTAHYSNSFEVVVKDGNDYQTNDKIYTFDTWKDGETPVGPQSQLTLSGDKTLVAQYRKEARKYTVTFVDEDGTTVLKEAVEYDYGTASGDIVKPIDPTKDATAEFTYEFDGWDTIPETLTENVVVKATYKSTKNKYTITFVDEDWSEIRSEDIEYGETPMAPTTPSKDPDDSCTAYVLSGWTPEIVPVVWVATYTVSYKCETVATYTITWNNDDGTTLETDENVPYNTTPTYDWATPTKTVEWYVYAWTWWSPTVAPVKWNETYTAIYDVACAANYHDKALETKTLEDGSVLTNGSDDMRETSATALECVSNTKTEWVACVEWTKPANSHYEQATWTWTWNEKTNTYVGESCPWACDSWYTKDGDSCKKNSWWGGGWGSGGGSYSCRNLPANAVANNDDKPSSSTSYSYSTDTSKVCTFQCKSWYTRNGEACVAWNSGGGWNNEEEIEYGWQVSDKCSVEWFEWSEEEKAAYLYACENDITTIRDINEARLGEYLNRAEMAKIVSVFATKELWMKPNTSKDCSNFAESMEGWSQEMKDYMVMSCQLELMWIHTVNYEAIPDFMPAKRVSRAEFWTILSRVLWWNKYEGTNDNYYFRHLDALKANNIITNIDPNITEYRSWVLLMIYRAVSVIREWKAGGNQSIENQVDEELAENSESFVGLANPASAYCVEQWWTVNIVKDDSWNESWMCKLADGTEVDEWEYYRANNKAETETGSVAEVETGSVAEVETWAVAEVETGSTTD